MNKTKLEQCAYAQGWVEGRLEEDLASVKFAEPVDEEEVKHRQEMLEAYMLVSNAFDELRRENADLQLRIAQAGTFLNR